MGRRTKAEIADDIRMQEAQLARTSGFGSAGTDSAFVADREQFNGYSHQQIWDQVHEKISPDLLGQIASHWGDRAQKLHDLFDTFGQGVKREFAEWSGAFAESAQHSANTFLTASSEAHGSALTVQRLMELNSSAAQTVRAAIPPPPPPYKPDPDPAKEAADGGARLRTYQSAASSAQAEVQDTMNFVYNPTIPASGDAVPRFVPPAPGPAVQPGPATPGPSATNSQPKPGTQPSATGKDAQPSTGKPGDQTQGNGTSPSAAQDQTQTASAGTSTATTPSSFSGLPTSTAATSTMPSNAASPAGAGPGGLGGSAAPGATSIGPVGTGTPGTPGTGSPTGGGRGASVPGAPVSSAAQANTVRTTPTVATAAQRATSSGMPHAGHGGKESDEERSKTSPEYLRRQYEELMELAPAGPGVIGINPAEEELPPTAPPPPAPFPPRVPAGPPPQAATRPTSPLPAQASPTPAPQPHSAPAPVPQPHVASAPPPQAPTAPPRAPEPPKNREGYVGKGPMEDG
ncbi:hypothetical protein ABIA39_000303 [Nocardia sp. GAS34]